jgi:PKD repeat protein
MAQVIARSRLRWSNPAVHLGILFLFLLTVAVQAFAGQASLAWDGSASPGVAGYMLYYGQTSGSYVAKVDVGNTTARTVTGLLEGKTYYYAVTAYDSSRTESGYSNQATSTVPYSVPGANFSANVTSGNAPLAVAFTNTSTGTITAYSWNFGDGTSSTSANPTHSYATAGIYSVSLTVTGPGGTNTISKASLITVTKPVTGAPVASFTPSATSGVAPLTINFTNSSTGTITAYAWNFGDGATSAAANPSHAYAAAGSYSVSLTVTGSGGSNTQTKANLITVSAPTSAPVASFSASLTSGAAPLAVLFNNTSTGTISSYAWNFGDGTTSSAQSPSHTYATAGTYSVSLTVTGSGGSKTLTKANYITVTSTPGKGSLSGTVAASSTTVNLSAVGTIDWAHWSGYIHKSTGGGKISTYSRIGSAVIYSYNNDPRLINWSGGTPTATGSNHNGVLIGGTGNGFQISAPADTTAHKLIVYVGGWKSAGKLTAHLSDGSAADYVNSSLSKSSGQYDGVYTLTYKAASAGQTISLRWTQVSGPGNVTLQGAALADASGTQTPPPASSDPSGLVAAYSFDEGSGSSVADVSGNGNTGTVSGATWDSGGRFGKALSFNGSNSWVTVKDSASLDLSNGMTLEAWVYPKSLYAWMTVMTKQQPSDGIYYLYANSDKDQPSTGVFISSERNLYAGSKLATYAWTHLAATYDGTTQRLYVNGVQVATRAQSGKIQTSSDPLRIGGNSVWGEYFTGLIDEVRVYNRALSPGEIQADMNTSVASSAN